MYCRVVVAALLLMVSAVASAAAGEIVEGQRGRSQGFVGDYSNTALTKRVVPRAGGSLAENEVVLQSYFVRKVSDNAYVFVGMLLNNSIAGVYDTVVTLYYPIGDGLEEIEAVRVYGTPAHILKKSYPIYSNYHYVPRVSRNYIPPKKNGYFEDYFELQDKYDFSKVRYEVKWNWTLQATIDTKVRVLSESVRIEPHEDVIRYPDRYPDRTKISGTLINELAVLIKDLGMTIIVLDKTNKQALDVANLSPYSNVKDGLNDVILSPNGTTNFVTKYDNVTNYDIDDIELLFVPYYAVHEAFVYPASYSDKAYISGPSTTIRDTVIIRDTVTVRDTVFVGSEAASRINALKKGDLNEDGVINVADFLIFTDNFGKTIGTD